jgi:hypothetical protein
VVKNFIFGETEKALREVVEKSDSALGVES